MYLCVMVAVNQYGNRLGLPDKKLSNRTTRGQRLMRATIGHAIREPIDAGIKKLRFPSIIPQSFRSTGDGRISRLSRLRPPAAVVEVTNHTNMKIKNHLGRALKTAALCSVLGLSAITVAHAALGESSTTVANDQVRMMATRVTHTSAGYTVHEMTLPRGTVVREYVAPSGVVFGVAWQGPAMPNLQQLLGSYGTEANTSVKAFREAHAGIGPVSVTTSDFVMNSAGHMGNYVGQAYLPAALPAGVTAHDIQ